MLEKAELLGDLIKLKGSAEFPGSHVINFKGWVGFGQMEVVGKVI